MRSVVISIFPYGCESWTLTAELEKRTQTFEMRWLLNISCKDHVTNEEVQRKTQAASTENDDPGQETETKVVWHSLKVFWFSKDNPTGQTERKKKKR